MFKIENRRYIGSKRKLINEIHSIIDIERNGYDSFFDVFGGTGVVTDSVKDNFDKLYINDILYSNYCIYDAFFGHQKIDENNICSFIAEQKDKTKLEETFFSRIYADTYFDKETAIKIGTIRTNIEKAQLNKREKNILISSLIYSADRCANTVGHYESFFKKKMNNRSFEYELIDFKGSANKKINIFRQDANDLIKNVKADVVYVDPPYNSRQYSRFYHLLETLVKWESFEPMGKALKPPLENLSGYSRNEATQLFKDLIDNLNAKLIIVSYNDTYNSSSSSSNNKIKYDEIVSTLESKGNVKVNDITHSHFNAGNTKVNNNVEYLFVCEVNND